MLKGITPRLSEGGKIKIGKKGEWRKSRGGGKDFQLPQKLDHFLITKTSRDDSGNFIVDADLLDALTKSPDGKIREIPIVLHSDNIDEVFPTAYARYVGRTCGCRGDGETATQWEIADNKRTGRSKSRDCPCEQLEARRCKPTGVLHCSIAAEGRAVAGSVYKWRTTSIISIEEMIGSLMHIKETCGVFRGLPLTLCLKPVAVRPDGKASTVYTCYVELRAKDLQAAQQLALQMAQMRQALSCDDSRSQQAYRALIEDPGTDTETEDEQAEVADEFYPPDPEPAPLEEGTHKARNKRRPESAGCQPNIEPQETSAETGKRLANTMNKHPPGTPEGDAAFAELQRVAPPSQTVAPQKNTDPSKVNKMSHEIEMGHEEDIDEQAELWDMGGGNDQSGGVEF